jgi:hypothetical protein
MSVLLVSAACGSSSSSSGTTGPTNTGTRVMTAKVDGVAWSTTSAGGSVSNGVFILAGSDGTQTVGISFAAGSTGTQSISPSTVVSGSLTIGAQTWKANVGTGTGTVTITTSTANHVAGAFSFTAQALVAGTSPAIRQVTAGTFDVTF